MRCTFYCLNCDKVFEIEHERFLGHGNEYFFCCQDCKEIFELKSISKVLGCTINNGFACSTCLMSWCFEAFSDGETGYNYYEKLKKTKEKAKAKKEVCKDGG